VAKKQGNRPLRVKWTTRGLGKKMQGNGEKKGRGQQKKRRTWKPQPDRGREQSGAKSTGTGKKKIMQTKKPTRLRKEKPNTNTGGNRSASGRSSHRQQCPKRKSPRENFLICPTLGTSSAQELRNRGTGGGRWFPLSRSATWNQAETRQ